jgi:DNA polymerase (family 10)
MTNKEVARILQETADLIKLTGGNEYRARAFSNASRSIGQLDESIRVRVQEKTLQELQGIGQGLAEDIRQLVQTGRLPQHQELLDQIPSGLTDVLRVKGLGPSRVRTLWKELGVASLDELETAGREDRLTAVKGFGKKTQANILEQIQLLRQYLSQYLFAEAFRESEGLIARLEGQEEIDRVKRSGALRRRMEVVDRIELVAATGNLDVFEERVENWFQQVEVTAEPHRLVVEAFLEHGMPVTVVFTTSDRMGTELWRQTGSDAHCEQFIAEYGMPAPAGRERDVYAGVGLPWIPPELREDNGEISAAKEDELPDLITMTDLQGSIHNHTTYSDGGNTVEEMTREARAMGHSYLVICDHSRSLSIANGLSIERVREQQKEIAAVNDMLGADGEAPFHIFSGIESDILPDGSLDYPDDVLDTFDLVVGSIHSRFNMTEEEATDRIVTAVQNSHFAILGHPTGRLLLRREGYPVDHERIIQACAEANVAIELNANPRRLDLDWRWIKPATDRGVLIAINPDAHTTEELHNMRWGVEVARKGWLEPYQCLNSKSLDEFMQWVSD